MEVGDGLSRCVGDDMRLLPVPEVVRVRLLVERTREVVDIVVLERWWRVLWSSCGGRTALCQLVVSIL